MRKAKSGRWHGFTGKAFGLVVVIGLIVLGTLRYLQPIPALSATSRVMKIPLPGAAQVTWPTGTESAVGAVGYGVLASSLRQVPVPIASVAKLITALAVLQKYPLKLGEQGPNIPLTAADVTLYDHYKSENGSTVQVQTGEQISEYQILQAMLLPSANNLADSAAMWAYGSMANYKTAATQLVQSIGMSQTNIGSDASGFAPDTTSTASDLIKLGELAMANSVLAQIVGQTTASLPVAGQVYNVDSLLGQDGVIGVKTGNSDQAGGVFLWAANDVVGSQTVVVIGAVTGAPDLQTAFSATLPLLNSAKSNFAPTTVVHIGDVVGSYVLPWGGSVEMIVQKDVTVPAWRGSTLQPVLAAHSIKVPLAQRSIIGLLSVAAGSQNISTPIVLQQSIPTPPWWWRILRHKV